MPTDVKYTVDRAFDEADPSVTQASWGPITGAEVVDPLTVKLTLEEPFVALIPFLADSFSSIICDSNEGAEGFGTTTAIGSGPWKLESWTKGDRLVLSANEDYVNHGKLAENSGAPHMDRLVISVVPESQARLAGLQTGEIDIAEPPLDDVEALRESGELDIVVAENTGQNVFWEFAEPPALRRRARAPGRGPRHRRRDSPDAGLRRPVDARAVPDLARRVRQRPGVLRRAPAAIRPRAREGRCSPRWATGRTTRSRPR